MKTVWLMTAAVVISGTALVFAGSDHGSMGMGGHKEGMMKGDSHERGQLHGGMSQMTAAHHFEVVYMPDGIRVYPYDNKQAQIPARGISGWATLTSSDDEQKKLALVYTQGESLGEDPNGARMQDYLFAPVDLSDAEPKSFRVKFALENLPGKDEEKAEFVAMFGGLDDAPYACPMHADVWGATADSKCPLCGMKTSQMRMSSASHMSGASDEQEHMGGHSH